MFMSALWDTIFEMNDRHSTMSVFLIDNHIPALSYGSMSNPTIYLSGFGKSEWETSVLLLKFFDNLLSNIESDTGMAGVRVKNAMKERGIIIIPAVCPSKMKYDTDKVSMKELLPIAKYIRFHKCAMAFALNNHGKGITYPETKNSEMTNSETIGKILSACSKLPIDKEADNEKTEFCRWVNEVVGVPAFTIALDNLSMANTPYIYDALEETFLVTALI